MNLTRISIVAALHIITMANVVDVCTGVPQRLLNTSIHDLHIADIVCYFTEWEQMAPYLGLTETEEADIREKYPNRPKLQRREALQLWKRKCGSKATYKALIAIFCEDVQRTDVAEKLRDLASQSASDSSIDYVLGVFSRYLIDCYTDFPHPSSSQLPFSSFKGYVNLDLCNAPINESMSNESSKQLPPIDIGSLVYAGNPKTKRKVVLMEGVAGSGKSTLLWYACNQWAQGKLFQEFRLLIHIPFSESEFHSACKLADLIPHPDEQMRVSVAKVITDVRGKGVCFLLDACDEAPETLRRSFLDSFISGKGRSMLPNVSIILASRSGVLDNYKAFLSGKVTVKGFTANSLHEFIHRNFLDDSIGRDQLIEALEMKPELHSLCCYPLNAVILIFLFDNLKDSLPSTQTALFHPLICNFLVRHIHTRESKDVNDVSCIESLPDDLPPKLAKSFAKVAQIAYTMLLENRKIDKSVLAKYGLDPSEDEMFGLLQIRPTIMTMYGPKHQYSFLHLSIQEFLAAVFISGLENHRQRQAVEELYRQDPLSLAISFFAGMTNMQNFEVQNILLQVLRRDLNSTAVLREVASNQNPAVDSRRQLLALTNCLYECQNGELSTKVVQMLSVDTRVNGTFTREAWELGSRFIANEIDTPDVNYNLPFLHMVLLPTDMLSIGNFARIVCEKLNEDSVVYLDLSYCNIGDVEFKALANELHKEVKLSKIMLRLNCIAQNSKTCLMIKKLIQGQSSIAGLLMNDNRFPDQDVTFALKCVIEGLSHNSACISIYLSGWHLNSAHIHYLLLLLRATDILSTLNLSRNDLRNGIELLGNALLYTRELFILDLSMCNIDDEALLTLGEILHGKQCSLFHLAIEFNPYTEDGLAEFFSYIYMSTITLLGARLTTAFQMSCLKVTNDIRYRHHLPKLEVRPYTLRDSLSMETIEGTQLTHYMENNPQLSLRSQ